jgi:hypothetical protein
LRDKQAGRRKSAEGVMRSRARFLFSVFSVRVIALRLIVSRIFRMLPELLIRHTDPKAAQATNVRARKIRAADAL